MRCYLFRKSRVTVLAEGPDSIPEQAELVLAVADLDQLRFPMPRLIEIWNALPGVEPVTRFRDRSVAVRRLWEALERLPITSSRTESKQARLISMLQRPGGATLDQLMEEAGWRRHSVRGVLSGVIRKKLKLPLTTVRESGALTYRI